MALNPLYHYVHYLEMQLFLVAGVLEFKIRITMWILM